MATGKKYGLIIPNAKTSLFTKRNVVAARPSVFGNDSSSDEDAHKEVNAQIHREALKKKIQKQTKIEIQKALEQDSTVYEYDSIYDDMKEKSKKKIPANVAKADKQKKPKYIEKLIKAAEKRTKERERIEERKIQRERAKEGDEFDDKEEFVTSAYRQKMLERQQEIEEEKRMDAIEEALDVRKQRDMTGFYRNFLNRELCEEPNDGDSTEPVKNTVASEDFDVAQNQDDEDTDLSFSSDEDVREKDSSPPEGRQSPIDKHMNIDKRRRDSGVRDNERVSPKHDSRDRDSKRDNECRHQSPERRYQSRDSPSRRREKDKHRRRRSHESDRSLDRESRSPHSRHRHKKHHRDTDERSTKRDGSRDRHHRKRQKRSGSERNTGRSASRSPSRCKDSKTDDKPTDFSTNALDVESGAGTEKAGVSSECIVEGPKMDDNPANSFARRTDKDKALSARERYLARKAAQQSKPVIDSD